MAGRLFNRPVSRYLVRAYCMARYGWASAHAEEWWPHLSLIRPSASEAGEIRYRGEHIAPLLPFPVVGARREVVIVGTGPSLMKQDRARIPIDSALLLNGAIHLIGTQSPIPLGVVIEDERFVWRHWRTIVARVAQGTRCYFSTSVIRALCDMAPDWLASQAIHHLDFVHRPYGRRRPTDAALHRLSFLRWSDDGVSAISLSPQAGIMPAGTVAASAAQIALSLAPTRIGLAGIDLTNTSRPRFYERTGDQAMSRLDAARGRILAAFAAIRDECDERGIALENYSPVSLLGELGIRFTPRLEK